MLAILVLAIAGAVVYALWPKPAPVEVAAAARGPMRVTVDEDGNTRIRERYVISAPLAGRLARITLDEGDAVAADETIVAVIEPTDPALLDPRARAEAEARVRAAEAAVDLAGAAIIRSNAALELAQSEVERLEQAAEGGATTAIELDRARAAESIRYEQAREARFAREVAEFELELARAALLRGGEDGSGTAGWRMEIRAPVHGRVLRVLQESAAVVAPGAPLVEIGDPSDIELVVDVLSSDAVAIRPGASASLEQWGGDAPLQGRVRLVEPAAFTKISALGVEEQRVNVIIDFVDPPQDRDGLGDGYRIEARITVWESPSVLAIPTGALFRHAGSWAVFTIDANRAGIRDVEIGHRNGEQAEVLSGLDEGESVVVYPSDRVHDGGRVVPRGR